ncbi:hypothetical protein KSC_004680 [Ktedonobacter sp. SOSP1-52]|nr:hypothetical protein KSC_004680 [Ktedonobacter sp. SOSP1-52]
MGENHGGSSAKDAGSLPNVPSRRSRRTSDDTVSVTFMNKMTMLESLVRGNVHAKFGEGRLETCQ